MIQQQNRMDKDARNFKTWTDYDIRNSTSTKAVVPPHFVKISQH